MVGGSDTTDEGAAGRKARRDLYEDGGKESGSRDSVLEARVQVAKDAHGEGPKGVGYLGVARETLGGEVVDNVTGKGDDDHDGSLSPFRLVDDYQTHGEKGNEYKCIVRWERSPAGRRGCRVSVDEAIDRGAYRDSEAEKE